MSSIDAEESSTVHGSLLYRLKHTWTIKDFASTYLVDSTDLEEYPQINSRWFNSSRDSQVEFRVNCQPRGRDEKSRNHLGLYLEMTDSGTLAKSAYVKFSLSLLNERKEKCNSIEYSEEFEYPSDYCGTSQFLAHCVLQDPEKGLLPDDQLTILVEVDVYPERIVKLGNELLLAKLKVASIEMVRSSLAGLLDSGEHSDVALVVDGKEYPVHQNLLSARSPVFCAMFKTEMAEQKDGKVIISDMKQEVAQELLSFIYKGKADDLEPYAEELLEAADKYDVTHLKELCGKYLCAQVNTENAARLLAIADLHSVAQLKTATVEFIRAHLEAAILTADWKLVQDLFTEELRKLTLKKEVELEKDDTIEDSSAVDGSLLYRLKHKWTIQDFAFTYLIDYTAKQGCPDLYSAWFSSSRDSQLKFRILLKPRGENENRYGYLSLYLETKRSGTSLFAKSANVKFKFSFIDERDGKYFPLETRQEFVYPKSSWGWSEALTHTILQNPANGLLPSDQLTILAEVDVLSESVALVEEELQLATLKDAAIESVRASLAGLLDSGENSDLLLMVDGEKLQAHKNLLSLHSPVFSGIFKCDMADQEEDGNVLFPDMKVGVAQAFLRFIYTGEVDDLDEYAEELLVAADIYEVALLKELCGQYLCAQVNTENAARLLAIADRHLVDQLKTVTVEFIRAHLEAVIFTADWKLVQDLFTEELRQLILKEKEDTETEKDDKRKTQEESESSN